MHLRKSLLASDLLLAGHVLAIELNLGNLDSIRDAARAIVTSIVGRYYEASDVSGLLGKSYYFWKVVSLGVLC
jgi:hypothetical protein